MGKKETPHWKDHGSAHSRGYGAAWRKRRALVLVRDLGLCQPCLRAGRTTQALQVDHIINKARGGSDHTDNLQAICLECHTEKTQDEAHPGKVRRVFDVETGWPVEEPLGATVPGIPHPSRT